MYLLHVWPQMASILNVTRQNCVYASTSQCASMQSIYTCRGAGINKKLKARGIQEGDTVVIGGIELMWSDDQSEGALYAAWREDKKRKGTAWQGSHSWPHAV